jgi:hypothetical protein
VESLAEDLKLSACGKQPSFTYSLSFDLVCEFCFVVFTRTHVCYSSLGEHSFTSQPTCATHFGIVFLATLGTMCHFSLGVG